MTTKCKTECRLTALSRKILFRTLSGQIVPSVRDQDLLRRVVLLVKLNNQIQSKVTAKN
jgi:hypothetical protein